MTKRIQSLLIAASLAFSAYGCDDDDSSANATRVAVADVAHGDLDLAPAELFERAAPAEVAMEEDRVSMPLSPREALQPFAAPESLDFQETTFMVEPGSDAGELLLPVDTAEGAMFYLAGKVSGTLEEQAVLNREVLEDIRIYDPSREDVLNIRDARTMERVGSTENAAGLDAPATPAPTDDATGSTGGVVAGGENTTVTVPGTDDPGTVLGDRAMGAVALEAGAEAGQYVLVYGERAAQIGFAVEVRLPESPVKLTMRPTADQLLLGSEGHVTATLKNGDAPLNASEVEAYLVKPDGSMGAQVPVTAAGAGTWHADVTDVLGADSPAGAYNVFFRASGQIDGAAFDRFGWTGFHFAVPTARVVAAATPTVVRENGKITALEVPVELQVASTDRYELTGTLVYVNDAGEALPLARAQTGAGLEAGNATVQLVFDAGHVKLGERDGRYELRHLTLYAQSQHGTLSRELGGLGLETEELETGEMADAELTPAMEVLLEQGMYGN